MLDLRRGVVRASEFFSGLAQTGRSGPEVGWAFCYQDDRLRYLANNSRFLILPDWHYPNLGSKVHRFARNGWGRTGKRINAIKSGVAVAMPSSTAEPQLPNAAPQVLGGA